jgi:hypothetical protein
MTEPLSNPDSLRSYCDDFYEEPDPDTYRMDWLEENLARIQEMPVKVEGERRYGFWCHGKMLFKDSLLRDVIDLARDHETEP